ncbi:Hypothetical predicted protein [Mytilus galloprovincialis]|uniref:Reverse transcriptase domain-containing protein n=1 Tax=Mytilus galloprovincialis TaxID=29158 RepID=A0A8B6CNB6_MYTGA|nr:Hypothetical predicted protein [Mytilus galloprovincialis]
MRDKTTELHETGKKLGLKINIKKTKIMKVKTRKGGTVSIEGENIEEVDQFTYLGSIMDRTGGTDADIRTRISKARQAFAMLKPVWKLTAFTENTKIRTITRQALEWNPQGHRRPGRPLIFTAGEDQGTKSWMKLDIPGPKQKG